MKLHAHRQIHKLDITNLCVPTAPRAHNSTFIRKELMSQHAQNESISVLPAHAVLQSWKRTWLGNACVTRQRHIHAPEPPAILPASLRSCSTPPLAGKACLCLRAGRKQRVPALSYSSTSSASATESRQHVPLPSSAAQLLAQALLRGAGRSQRQPAASLHSQVPEHSRAVSGLPSPWAARSMRVHV